MCKLALGKAHRTLATNISVFTVSLDHVRESIAYTIALQPFRISVSTSRETPLALVAMKVTAAVRTTLI
jgi:hypothetical protein